MVPDGLTPVPAPYDGVPAAELARLLDLPQVESYAVVPSTMDLAHAAAQAGTPAGTLILADRQSAGRGRNGRRWASASGAGLWLTMIERPADPSALDVLSLRLGLGVADVLDRYMDSPVRLKWPNDLFAAHGGKLAGILVEARWHDERPAWVAIGIGINVRLPADVPDSAALKPDSSRVALLTELMPAVRAAASARGTLTDDEMADYSARDLARGQPCREPAVGTVAGITASGELLVRSGAAIGAYRSGSLVFAPPQ
jgi:BirA family biotin operon repressor/biotin-[acetyl-CoA-carboxylase] ligase